MLRHHCCTTCYCGSGASCCRSTNSQGSKLSRNVVCPHCLVTYHVCFATTEPKSLWEAWLQCSSDLCGQAHSLHLSACVRNSLWACCHLVPCLVSWMFAGSVQPIAQLSATNARMITESARLKFLRSRMKPRGQTEGSAIGWIEGVRHTN
jgi:hypothetical protein